MKKFYIVKDETDLLSGKIIPQKVLDYIPVGALGPIIRPIPIRKSSELVVPVGGPQLGVVSPVFSPVSITKSIAPLSPTLSPGCGQAIMPSTGCSSAPLSPIFSRSASPLGQTIINRPTFGPPIIKLAPMINMGVNGIVKIIGPNAVYTINVPPTLMRSVVNDIYLNSQVDLDPLQPKFTFRIITPTIDSSIRTTLDRMIEIVKMINSKYSGLSYVDTEGRTQNLFILLNLLLDRYKAKNLIL